MIKELDSVELARIEFEKNLEDDPNNEWLKRLIRGLKMAEQSLQLLEEIYNANPSEALEGLKTSLHNEWLRFYPQLEQMDETTKIVDGCRMIKSDADNYLTIKNYILKAQRQEALLKSGDLSDGYHTFNQLYYQRCVLFASLVRLNKDKSWKSFKHSDGKYCFDSNGEWFIVGIDTPIGSYTYHYEKKYWDLFECQELECGKEWDGHTEEDVTRLLSLPNEQEKVLEIIKEKCLTNCNLWLVSNLPNYEQYIVFIKDKTNQEIGLVRIEHPKLTEEEFNLLKRWNNGLYNLYKWSRVVRQ